MGCQLGAAGEHPVNGMNPFFREVDRLEEDLKPFARNFEVRARRFLGAFLPALVTALLAAPSKLTLGLILSIGLSVAVTVAGEIDPSIPWGTLIQRLDVARWRDPVDAPAPKKPGP